MISHTVNACIVRTTIALLLTGLIFTISGCASSRAQAEDGSNVNCFTTKLVYCDEQWSITISLGSEWERSEILQPTFKAEATHSWLLQLNYESEDRSIVIGHDTANGDFVSYLTDFVMPPQLSPWQSMPEGTLYWRTDHRDAFVLAVPIKPIYSGNCSGATILFVFTGTFEDDDVNSIIKSIVICHEPYPRP